MTAVLLSVSIILFIIAYFTYGRYIRNILQINNNNKTPSHYKNDGIDYVPTNKFILMGHHFASIAGVGPIVGPILGVTFGWLPAVLWIILGGIFIGAVHDFTSMVISMRKQGKTIGSIIEDFLGSEGKKVFLIFTWFTLILVIAVFTIVVAQTFEKHPEAGTASMLFILLAILFGFSIYRLKLNIGIATLFGVVLLFLSILIGLNFPLKLTYNTWVFILIIYIFLASITPVWILLQPRDYLNSFLLYILLIGGLIGVFFYRPDIKLEVFRGFYDPGLGWLFPVLFVTIACGAISGFHSLVSSGTTSKQIDKESDTQFVGYGGMLLEGVLAILSIIIAIMLTRTEYLVAVKNPISLFSNGMGNLLQTIGIPSVISISFAALAISAFALTSLDTSARIGRYTFEEFFDSYDLPVLKNRIISSVITVGAGAALAFNKGGAMAIWPLFGSANQMLASLALIAATLYFVNKHLQVKIVLIPSIIMFTITISALGSLIYKNFLSHNWVLVIIGIILFITATYILTLPFKYKNKIAE
ncbi:MAG: carbon starvation protein A [Candidatus Goldbacteria bacterium]|nr:carbon starvation protein A [Candidatus Goldiibacteriota bacterium]